MAVILSRGRGRSEARRAGLNRCRPSRSTSAGIQHGESGVKCRMPDFLQQRFAGIDRLYGNGAAAKLASSSACVVGLGGVGSWLVEALARSGVGRLVLIDADDICLSNTNRQLHAFDGQYGRG